MTEEEVLTIRMLYLEGATQKELTARYGLAQSSISKIVNGIAYPHVAKPETIRMCKDCKTPLATSKKRCASCHTKWQHEYFNQWYEKRKASSL